MKDKTDAELIADGGREIEIAGEKKVLFFNNLALCTYERLIKETEIASELALAMVNGCYESVVMGLWIGLSHDDKFKGFKTYHEMGDYLRKNQDGFMTQIAHFSRELLYTVMQLSPKKAKELIGEDAAPLAKKTTAKKKSGPGKKN